MNTEDFFCDTSNEGAKFGLLALMTGISEEHWCAGWMSGLEFALWQAQPDMLYGQERISKRQARLLRLLSDECGGWWRWIDNGPQFITKSEWLKTFVSCDGQKT